MSDARTAPDTSADEFLAGRALAQRGDPWAELNQRYPAPPPAGAAKTEAPPQPVPIPTPPDAPIGQRILSRLTGIASAVGGVARGAGEAILGDVTDLFKGIYEAGPGTVEKVLTGELQPGTPEAEAAARSTAMTYGVQVRGAPETLLRARGAAAVEAERAAGAAAEAKPVAGEATPPVEPVTGAPAAEPAPVPGTVGLPPVDVTTPAPAVTPREFPQVTDPLTLMQRGELTAESAQNIADTLSSHFQAVEKEVYGEDAEELARLRRQSNSAWERANDARAKEIDARIGELEAKHDPTGAGADYLSGLNGPEHIDPEGWQEMARDLKDVEASREDAVEVVASKLRWLPDGPPVTQTDRETVAVIGRAIQAEVERGGNPADFLKDALKERFQRYGGGADAAELVNDQAERLLNLAKPQMSEAAGEPPPLVRLPPPTPPETLPPAATAAPAPAAAPKDPLALGDPLAPAVTVKPATQAEQAMAEVTLGRMPGEGEPPSIMSEADIHSYLDGARVDNPVKVNLARIGSGEDIADILAQVSKTIPATAVQTLEATRYAADALGLTPEQLLQNYRGQQLNSVETTAMRLIVDSSAAQLREFAQKVRDPMAGPADIAAFTKAFTVHRALQQYMENARAEAARTLGSWRILSEQRDIYGRAISKLVADNGDDVMELAGKIADLTPLQAGRLVASSMQGTARDVMLALGYNAWLSSPSTLTKKIGSDIGMAMWNLATRGFAETAGRAGMNSGAIVPGETASLAFGYMNSLTDALRAGGKGLMAGRSQFMSQFATQEQPFRLSQLANGYPAPIEAAMPSKAMFDYIRPLLPTSWMAGADDFAKMWQYQAQYRALAWRAAEGDPERFADLLNNRPQSLHQQATLEALTSTFHEPLTGAAEWLRGVIDAVNIPIKGTDWQIPLGRIIMPFFKVPVNIGRMAYRSSPLAYVFPSSTVKAIMATPGASRDLLMAQIGLGTAVDVALTGLALNGNITGRGPTDPGLNREWQDAGNQPYSLQLPGARPIDMHQFEPFGLHLAAIADTINLFKFAKDEDSELAALSSVFGVGNAMLSKNYFEGIANFLDALTHPDQDAGRYTRNLVAGFVPNALRHLGNATDDWVRAHYRILDSIEANLPWLREGLPPARSLWGKPIPVKDTYLPFLSGTGVAQMVSPVNLGKPPEDVEPIDRWIWDHHGDFDNPEHGIEKPPRNLAFSAGPGLSIPFELNAKQYDRFVEQAGNGLKNPDNGLGAMDMLNALVQGRGPRGEQDAWNEASPAEQTFMVQSYVKKYREAAKVQLWQPHNGVPPDFPEMQQAIEGAARARGAVLMGR